MERGGYLVSCGFSGIEVVHSEVTSGLFMYVGTPLAVRRCAFNAELYSTIKFGRYLSRIHLAIVEIK